MQAYPLRKTLLRNIFAFASNRLGGKYDIHYDRKSLHMGPY